MRLSVLIFCLSCLTGCVVNPVTGENQFSLLTTQNEIAIGEQQYGTAVQQQGGEYIVDPTVTQYVRDIGHSLARLSHQPTLPFDFVVINSSVPNAWALPGGKIAINRGLLTMLDDEAELAAVMGHEIVHVTARHGAQSHSKSILLDIGASLAEAAAGDLGSIVGGTVRTGGGLVMAKYSRAHELEADFYGTYYLSQAGYDPRASADLQHKLMQLSKGSQADALSALFSSHPPSQQRMMRNEQTAATLTGKQRHRARFQLKMARLFRDFPAYQAYDQAIKDLQNKDTDRALTNVNRAIKLQARESSFWELKGDLLWQRQQQSSAITAYSKAIGLNPQYFQHHLARGLAYYGRKAYGKAKRDFNTANQYLPTRMAVFYLGESAFNQGYYQEAANHYQQLASGGDQWAQTARARLNAISGK